VYIKELFIPEESIYDDALGRRLPHYIGAYACIDIIIKSGMRASLYPALRSRPHRSLYLGEQELG